MCFLEPDDNEETQDFSAEKFDVFSHFTDSDVSCEDQPDEHVLFHVSLNTHQILLASALIGMAQTLEEARAMVEAAWAMRDFLFLKAVEPSQESRQWNEQYEIGTVVQYFPKGRNSEQSYLGQTSSPAIDTQSGPVVLIRGYMNAVSLIDVIPRQTISPEVLS